jgi:hypothetical protein
LNVAATTSKKALLPGYKATLYNPQSRKSYEEKLSLLGRKDPYETPTEAWKDDVELWASITYIHVGMYLVFSPSPYTGQDLLNYKSLECYQRFKAGEILVSAEGEHRLLTAKVNPAEYNDLSCDYFLYVNHSQKMREKPLIPWIVAKESGKVVAGHCNCMAGLRESCSHIASLLWALEAGVRQ